jgi:integrase
MDPFTLQYLAGHKNIATTMRYIHLARTDAQEKLREIRQRMEDKVEAQGGHNSRHSAENQAA